MDKFDSCTVLRGEVEKLEDAIKEFTNRMVNQGLDPDVEAESQFFAMSLKSRLHNFGSDMQDVCMIAI